jgi:hypothetical protein
MTAPDSAVVVIGTVDVPTLSLPELHADKNEPKTKELSNLSVFLRFFLT